LFTGDSETESGAAEKCEDTSDVSESETPVPRPGVSRENPTTDTPVAKGAITQSNDQVVTKDLITLNTNSLAENEVTVSEASDTEQLLNKTQLPVEYKDNEGCVTKSFGTHSAVVYCVKKSENDETPQVNGNHNAEEVVFTKSEKVGTDGCNNIVADLNLKRELVDATPFIEYTMGNVQQVPVRESAASDMPAEPENLKGFF